MKSPIVLAICALAAVVLFAAVQMFTNTNRLSPATTASLETQFEAERGVLIADQAVLTDRIAEMEAAEQAKTDALAAAIAERDVLVTTLTETNALLIAAEADMSGFTGDANAEVQALANQVTTYQGEVETLTAEIAQSYEERAAFIDRIATLEAALVTGSGSTDDQVLALENKASVFATEIELLKRDVSERDAIITELLQGPGSGQQTPAAACQDLTATAFSETPITFVSGSSGLTDAARSAVAAFAEIAAECIGKDLVLDIEGHTDGQGGFATNLLLSNSRAKAVYDALADSGVPTTAMRAVGFGASDPIASTHTSEGRAQNERIVLDWSRI